MKFHVIKLGSRPLLAVPAGHKGLWQAAIACYPAHTMKKRVVRGLLRILAGVGLLRLVFPARALSECGVAEVDFEDWIMELCERLDMREIHPVLVWPGDPGRGRVYAHLLDAKGKAVAFGKLGLDERNNVLIEKESRALELLESMQLKQSRVPRLLAHGELDVFTYIVVETLPAGARATDWISDPPIDENIAEYAGSPRRLEREELESLPWWSGIETALADNVAFMQKVNAAADQGIDVSFAHGDLNCTNVLRHENDVWLLDWEQCDANAPCLTDRVCMVIDKLWLTSPDDAAGNLQKLRDAFGCENEPKTHSQIILALAFLAAADFPPAIAMIEAWYPDA